MSLNNAIYLLTAELRNETPRFSDDSRFEYVLQVSEVEDYKEVTFWEAASGKHHPANNPLGLTILKINIAEVSLNLSPRLQKATDFIRRLSYAYDEVELMIDDAGCVHKVRNVETLNGNWAIIREMLEADYKGAVVDEDLYNVDSEISRWSFLNSGWNYLMYGLLFPNVPCKHAGDWTNERDVTVSRYDEEQMRERISFCESRDGNRKYNITGTLQEGSKLQLERFDGMTFIKKDEILPNYATVKVDYRNGDIANLWNFKLDRY